MTTGSILKAYREKNNLSQEAVATFLQIKRELLSYYENDSRQPSIEVLENLANLYGTEMADFFETDIDLVKTNVAFAFRATHIDDGDLKQIAQFRKVVRNYLKIIELEKKNVE